MLSSRYLEKERAIEGPVRGVDSAVDSDDVTAVYDTRVATLGKRKKERKKRKSKIK